MPLLSVRSVEPKYVSRETLPEKLSVQNDLEAVANGTLSHVILQLSSLSQHAEEIFTDLVRVATGISSRSISLQGRLNRLAVKMVELDDAEEEACNSTFLDNLLNVRPFEISTAFDQEVVSRASMSNGMLQKHANCGRPPPLEKLNVFRDDGKDGLKSYTDPSYFFDRWRQEMLKDTEKAVRKLNKPHKKDGGRTQKVRQLNKTRDKHRNMAIERGEHIIPTSQEGQEAPKSVDVGDDGVIYSEMPREEIVRVGSQRRSSSRASNARDNLPPPPPPPSEVTAYGEEINGRPKSNNHPLPPLRMNSMPPPPAVYENEEEEEGEEEGLPPPPPIPDQWQPDPLRAALPRPPSISKPPPLMADKVSPPAPAPPPPPPPPPLMADPVESPAETPSGIGAPKLKRVIPPPQVDTRSELLSAIRGGIRLNKVKPNIEVKGSNKASPTKFSTVAEILIRRAALKMSDSESDSSEDSSDEEWDEMST